MIFFATSNKINKNTSIDTLHQISNTISNNIHSQYCYVCHSGQFSSFIDHAINRGSIQVMKIETFNITRPQVHIVDLHEMQNM